MKKLLRRTGSLLAGVLVFTTTIVVAQAPVATQPPAPVTPMTPDVMDKYEQTLASQGSKPVNPDRFSGIEGPRRISAWYVNPRPGDGGRRVQ